MSFKACVCVCETVKATGPETVFHAAHAKLGIRCFGTDTVSAICVYLCVWRACKCVFLNASPSRCSSLDATGLSPLSAAHQEYPGIHTLWINSCCGVVGYQILYFSLFSVSKKGKKRVYGPYTIKHDLKSLVKLLNLCDMSLYLIWSLCAQTFIEIWGVFSPSKGACYCCHISSWSGFTSLLETYTETQPANKRQCLDTSLTTDVCRFHIYELIYKVRQ